MTKDRVYDYFIQQDHNCAESLLLAANDEYHLNLTREEMKLLSAFGGGMGCGKACGALCGCMAVLGRIKVQQRAHEDKQFGSLCAALCQQFVDVLGDSECEVLKPLYRNDQVRCLKTVELAADVLDQFLAEHGLRPQAQ